MKPPARLSLVLAALFCLLVLSETMANAYCPPGTHWSNRARACVPNRYGPPPPPPPPDPYRHRHRHPRRGGNCEAHYHQCLFQCGGQGRCVQNCNVGFTLCRQQRGW